METLKLFPTKMYLAAQALRDRAREEAALYATDRGLEFPGVSLIASGSRPV